MTDRPKKKIIINPLAGVKFDIDFRERDEIAFEDSTVRYLLGTFGAEKTRWELIRQHEQATGEKRLTLLDFCHHYDSFPLVLQSLVTEVSKSNKMHVLFKSFGDRPLMKKWFELRNDLPHGFHDRPFGLVVKWAYINRGLLFHTLGDLETNGVRLHWRDRRFELTVEPLEQFVTWLQKNWSP